MVCFGLCRRAAVELGLVAAARSVPQNAPLPLAPARARSEWREAVLARHAAVRPSMHPPALVSLTRCSGCLPLRSGSIVRRAKQCKMCEFMVTQIRSEPEWSAETEAYEAVRHSPLCAPLFAVLRRGLRVRRGVPADVLRFARAAARRVLRRREAEEGQAGAGLL